MLQEKSCSFGFLLQANNRISMYCRKISQTCLTLLDDRKEFYASRASNIGNVFKGQK